MEEEEYEEQAKSLVDAVIDNALKKLEAHVNGKEVEKEEYQPPREDYEMRNIEWLQIHEFSVDKAQQKIDEFIKTWDYDGGWLYCIDFLGEDDYEFDKRYRFRVRWSIPTRRKPIPRATACVYFTFVVSKIKPKDNPVEVFYVFETNRLVHKPGESRFREKWLKDIVESKIMLMASIDF